MEMRKLRLLNTHAIPIEMMPLNNTERDSVATATDKKNNATRRFQGFLPYKKNVNAPIRETTASLFGWTMNPPSRFEPANAKVLSIANPTKTAAT